MSTNDRKQGKANKSEKKYDSNHTLSFDHFVRDFKNRKKLSNRYSSFKPMSSALLHLGPGHQVPPQPAHRLFTEQVESLAKENEKRESYGPVPI